MEYVKKGALGSKTYWEKELNRKLEEDEVPKEVPVHKLRNYLRDFLLGLDYLHNFANIVHRDIKPDNLLIDAEDHLKIADFGVAKMMEDNQDEIQGEQGTKSFLTPEHYEGKTVKGKSADIWAIGVTFYLLAFGKQPF
jgi:[calcium/calmodulin-dependent protein kinase] kinase